MKRRQFLKDATLAGTVLPWLARNVPAAEATSDLGAKAGITMDAALAKDWLARWEKSIVSDARNRYCDREMGEEIGWLVSPFLNGFYGGYYEIDVEGMVAAFEHGLVFTKEDIHRLIATNRDFMWNQQITGPGSGGSMAASLTLDGRTHLGCCGRPWCLTTRRCEGSLWPTTTRPVGVGWRPRRGSSPVRRPEPPHALNPDE